ncbi:trimethylamine monooxygenase [Mycetocola sp. BIGb0189]|uniref:NAD(P)-binding domain-containing protein n=1 Tax=Mycetocola sp. BIGb0189 TaxID=2940604 RepID=UPI0021687502|nr:NAD(P)/FAD-dependent oxidoreductase [Mycetocola sp. BIGb0189]MCS4277419.1 trimethylamine monooxygenase [Mycetocola sp. BIGb0189]
MVERIAIIGAGPSGMAQLRAFEAARESGAEIPEIVCFEKQADWGGQWNYSWRTGIDQHGEPVHSSMYRNLWSNGPKEALEFADYSFDQHFGKPISSYPPRAVLWDYIAGRVEASDVRRFVRFNTIVRWTQETEDGFTVASENLADGETTTEHFDRIIVASGHFSFPNVPDFDGLENFTGEVMHAHDFRGAERLAGKRVLMIGASYSAEDIGMQAHKMGAELVTLSYRSHAMGFDWPAGVEELPLAVGFDGSTVTFRDGSVREVDAVVLCTGYLHKYPFLPDSLALSSPNNLYPDGLYKGTVWQGNPNLFYVGAQDQWFTFNMFDAQAWFVRDVILGRISLPDAEDRAADIRHWLAEYAALPDHDSEVVYQANYIRDLIERTDYPMFDLDEVVRIFQSWQHDKQVDIARYRDKTYPSVMTGTMAAVHHTPWLEEMDDSIERYLTPVGTVADTRDDAIDVGTRERGVTAAARVTRPTSRR